MQADMHDDVFYFQENTGIPKLSDSVWVSQGLFRTRCEYLGLVVNTWEYLGLRVVELEFDLSCGWARPKVCLNSSPFLLQI